MKKLVIVVVVLLGMSCWQISPAADFDGDSRDDIAIFRPSSGLWAIQGVTRVYFGDSTDNPAAGDYNGDGIADIGIYRESSGLWAIRDVTRAYFGSGADIPIPGGGGQRLYDYVVRPGDAIDLVRALESDSYRSVFIPAGTYAVGETILVDHVRKIVGEEQRGTELIFPALTMLDIHISHCKVEGIRLEGGGSAGNFGNLRVRADYVTIRDCLSTLSNGHGFQHYSGGYVSFIDCIADNANNDGFHGTSSNSCRFVNCAARACDGDGFEYCNNISNCYVDGYGNTLTGFKNCDRVATSYAYGCDNYGFSGCMSVSACMVDTTETGFLGCSNISACHADNCSVASYTACSVSDDATNKYSCD